MSDIATEHHAPFIDLLLALADDKLMLGHRDSDWTGLGPILEEDIASSSLAQDEIAHASALYELVAEVDGTTADALAFGRAPADYRCAAIVEISDDFDWARTIVRRFFCDHFDALRLERMARSSYEPLAALARRLADEEAIHVEHVDAWIERLGRGTAESRDRLVAAFEIMLPLATSLLEPVDGEAALEAAGLYPALEPGLRERYQATLQSVVDRAGVDLQIDLPEPTSPGGRRGHHSADLDPLLDEMCEVFRLEPNSPW